MKNAFTNLALSILFAALAALSTNAASATAEAAVDTAKLQPGAVFRDCANCPEMVVIPAGSFLMGTSQADMDRYLQTIPAGSKKVFFKGGSAIIDERASTANDIKDELPQHEVHIVQPFALGKYPVTRGEFAAFVQATGYKPKGGCPNLIPIHPPGEPDIVPDTGWQKPGIDQTDRDPVVCVNVHDAEAYVDWLNTKIQKPVSAIGMRPYRLPSEAEWEYAARAGTQTDYWWGDSTGTNNAVCNGCGSPWDNRKTAPVGSFKPNPFGLYDMLSNVSQWMADCANIVDYSGAPTDGSAWISGDCTWRILRGGDWKGSPIGLRSARRGTFMLDGRENFIGFRVARVLQ